MDEKTNPTSPEIKPDEAKIAPTPINTFSPSPNPIKFSSPFSPSEAGKMDSAPKNPIDSLPKADPVKDFAANLKTNPPANSVMDAPNMDSIKNDTASEEKKSGAGLYIVIAIIVGIAAAIIAGVLVYVWQSSLTSPLQKEKSQLQSQVGNLQSQVDVLQKDKVQLQSDLDSLKLLPPLPATPPPTAPGSAATPTPETQTPPVVVPAPTPTPAPTSAPTPGQ
jgi:hypothetical protein